MTPTGWQEAMLGDVCRVVSGATPKTGVADYWGGDIRWITPNDLSKDRSQILREGARSLTRAGYDSCSARLVPSGSVVVSSRAPVGYVAIAGAELCTNQGCKTAIPPDFIDSKYLYWYLITAKPDLEARASGTTFKEISGKRFSETRLRWPDLHEQRRIVDLLEDHLSRLDAARSYLATADRRAGLLWAAGLSDLTLPPAAQELMKADPAVLGHDSPPAAKLPAGWRWARWADLGTSENGKPFSSGDYQDTGLRLLRPGNLGPKGVLTWRDANTRFMPNSYRSSHPTSMLQPGDLVMNLTAQSLKDDFLGRVCLVRKGDESLLNQRIARLRSTGVDSGFALAVFRSRLFRHYVKSLSTGSLIQHMFTSQLDRFWIPVPPATEQQRIARAADILQADIARQVEVIRLQGQRSALLRRSILAAAFSGRLTGSASGLSVAEEMIGA